MSLRERLRSGFLRVAGYLVLLVQSLPPLGVWTGLMTVPFASYLIMVFRSLPESLPRALREFFLSQFHLEEKVFIILGLVILVYSVVFLRMKKGKGLVTSGPYRFVRHPQYLGMMLMTLGLTSWSYWILRNTFGTGFLSPLQTIGVWFIQLVAYTLLACVEERYLSKSHGKSFENYRRQVPFFIPFVRTGRAGLDVLASIAIPAILLLLLTVI